MPWQQSCYQCHDGVVYIEMRCQFAKMIFSNAFEGCGVWNIEVCILQMKFYYFPLDSRGCCNKSEISLSCTLTCSVPWKQKCSLHLDFKTYSPNACQAQLAVNLCSGSVTSECHMWSLARARPAVPFCLWSITSSFHGNFYVPRLHKFIKWFADNDVTHRN